MTTMSLDSESEELQQREISRMPLTQDSTVAARTRGPAAAKSSKVEVEQLGDDAIRLHSAAEETGGGGQRGETCDMTILYPVTRTKRVPHTPRPGADALTW